MPWLSVSQYRICVFCKEAFWWQILVGRVDASQPGQRSIGTKYKHSVNVVHYVESGSHSVTSTLRSQAASRAKQIQYPTCPSELDLPNWLYAWRKMNIHWATYWHNIPFHLFTAIIKTVSTNPMFEKRNQKNFEPIWSTFYPHHLVL
jgi:hypothetical protein